MTDAWGEVVKWIAATTGLVTIRGQESGPRPVKPYIMVNFLSQREVRANPQRVAYNEDVPSERIAAKPVRELAWMFSIHAYGGDDPAVYLEYIKSASKLAQAQEPLFPDLVVGVTSEIRNVPDWDGVNWEKRAQMDLTVTGLDQQTHVIDTIEQYSFDFERV